MPVNSTFADLINAAFYTGHEASFTVDGVEYEFTPQGLFEFITSNPELVQVIEDIAGSFVPTVPTAGTYFVDALSGNDSNNGRSTTTAFQSINKVNGKSLLPGDIVSFKRGQTHVGTIALSSSGNAALPLLFNGYGTGALPVISSGEAEGFVAIDKQHFTIDGLEFVGARDPIIAGDDVVDNAVDGVHIENSQAGDTQLLNVRVQNCVVSHYGGTGINLIGTEGASGFTSPLIDNNEVFACTHNLNDGSRQAGIRVSADVNFGANANGYAHNSVIIRGNVVHDCLGTLGDEDRNGSGIDIGQVDGGSVIGNVVYNCGQLSAYPEGPYGIRVEDSNEINIENNETYNNSSVSTVVDGGGIGILGGCTDCTVQDSYIHGERGSGIVLYSSATADLKAWNTNTARFNVLEGNDVGEFPLGASLSIIADANMIGASVHNNTIYQRGPVGRNCLLLASSTGVTVDDFEGYIANNIIVSTNGATLVRATSIDPTFMRLRGNDYYAPTTFKIHWDATDYSSIAAWQAVATTQEKISAVNVSYNVDPLLTNPATGGVINADNSLLTGYKLQEASTMRTTGLDILGQFSIDPGDSDFYGTTIGITFNIGSSYAVKNGPLAISGTPILNALTLNAYQNWTVTAAGGTGSYTFSLVGTWPSGITIHATTGVVSGTPLAVGTYPNLSVRVTDNGSAETVTMTNFTISVSSGVPTVSIPPTITPDAIYGGYAGSVWTVTNANWSVGVPTNQWYADGVAIGGATSATYTMTLTNENKKITCRQTNGGVVSISNEIELWSPLDVAEAQPLAIFDIRQGLTLTGALVDTWAASTGGVTATGTTTTRPSYGATALGGKPGITFDNANSTILTGIAISTVPTARTVVAIGSWAVYGTSQYFLSSSVNNGYAFRRNTNNGQVEVQALATAVRASSSVGVASTGNPPRLASSRFTTVAPSFFDFHGGGLLKGTGTPTGGFAGSGTATIGSATTGILGSMVIHDAVLSDDHYQRLIAWVAWTSGLPASLVSGTPYKTAAPRATTLTATILSATVPEGTQEEEIITTIPTSILGGTYTMTTGGQGMDIVDGDLIISDKAAFFAVAEPTVNITVSKTATTPQLFTVNCTIVPGYYDIGAVAADNIGLWFDFTDHKTFETEAGGTYIAKLTDKSSYNRDMINPWYPDRRPKLVNPGSLKPGVAALRNEDRPKSTLFGLANLENPIWHGIRSFSMLTPNQLQMVRALAPTNDDTQKTWWSGLPSMTGRNLLLVIYGNSTGATLRIDGVVAQTKTPSTGVGAYTAPVEPYLLVAVVRMNSYPGVFWSPNHIGQHPYWEDGDFNGDIAELIQLYNVSVVP